MPQVGNQSVALFAEAWSRTGDKISMQGKVKYRNTELNSRKFLIFAMTTFSEIILSNWTSVYIQYPFWGRSHCPSETDCLPSRRGLPDWQFLPHDIARTINLNPFRKYIENLLKKTVATELLPQPTASIWEQYWLSVPYIINIKLTVTFSCRNHRIVSMQFKMATCLLCVSFG